jgi:hypothetical protein
MIARLHLHVVGVATIGVVSDAFVMITMKDRRLVYCFRDFSLVSHYFLPIEFINSKCYLMGRLQSL